MYLFHRHIDLASELKKAVGLAVGAAIYSAGLNLFLIPNDIIDGGITGISLLMQALTGIPFSVLIVLLNLPFFYIGYRRLGARLALSSTFAIVIALLVLFRDDEARDIGSFPLDDLWRHHHRHGCRHRHQKRRLDRWHGDHGDLDG